MRPLRLLYPLLCIAIIAFSCYMALHSLRPRKTISQPPVPFNPLEVPIPGSSPSTPVDSGIFTQNAVLGRGSKVVEFPVHGESVLDVRSARCGRRRYKDVVGLKASVVMDLTDAGTVESEHMETSIKILLSGAQNAIEEIILVATVGVPPSTLETLDAFLKSLDVPTRIIKEVGEAGIGQGEARMAGFTNAKSDFVVFAEVGVISTEGWLLPLIGALLRQPKAVVVPHLDDVTNPEVYLETSEHLLTQYTWPLTIRMMENPNAESLPRGFVKSPMIRGNVFAVRRSYFSEIGGYDTHLLNDAAASHLELSLRVWLCGGLVLMIPCSHLGVRNLQDPVRVVEEAGIQRVGMLWFADWNKVLLSSMGFKTDETRQNDSDSPVATNTCRDISVFFNTVAAVPIPAANAVQFGQLRTQEDACAHGHADGRLDLTRCWPNTPNSLASMIFELNDQGNLFSRTNGLCVSVQHNSFVLLTECDSSEGINGERQRWRYDVTTGRLVNPWSKFCAMHVTDPDSSAGGHRGGARQIIMAQNCTVDLNTGQTLEEGSHQFMRWKFVSL